uniref:JmjC domain-containing protein n=1 Tax=Haptolina brevifila TaxID=156173 RepID=A0A7S2D5Z6_9EUKA|mmetsp:Transcript_32966/g.65578  ORF Transcript_32966/g.65578 Transcript_32966/m.65578 type:complete len:141 (+) Transcript_32966:1029-1451(+)
MIKGRKRWVLLPPSAGTGRSGGAGSEPPGAMHNQPGCVPDKKPLDAMHCDQEEGDVIWVPNYWWHETCGLDDYSIGIGALTYDGCCPAASSQVETSPCYAHKGSESYRITHIPSCLRGEMACGTLPDGEEPTAMLPVSPA